MLDNHGDILACTKCLSLAFRPESEQFAFAITQRKDGTKVDPPFLGVIMLAKCADCGYQGAVIDSPKSPEHWASLTKWETPVA